MDNINYTLSELKKLLNEKQIKFCHRWIIDFNNVQSYMYAYPDCEYKSASASADRLLENDRIKQYIDLIKNNLEQEAGISKLGNLKILIGMATKAEPDSTKVAALKEINSMMGYNEATKIDLGELTITLPKLVFDDLNEG